jgi:hypothetical protein
MVKRCVFKESEGLGARVFYFRYSEPEEGKFDYEAVWVYTDEDLKHLVMGCHVSNIVILDDSMTTERQMGDIYLTDESFRNIKDKWKAQ